MAFGVFQSTITDQFGNVVPGAPIEVRRDIVGSPLATIYADRDGNTTLDNPTQSDVNGFIRFYADGNPYKITATMPDGSMMIWRHVPIGTAAENDAEDLIVGIADEGDWANGTNYNANNTTYDNGTTYLCTAPHLSDPTTEPGVGVNWQTVWRVFARRGGNGGGEWLWDTGTTNADPGTGKVRFDNASPGSAANIYISETSSEVGGPSYAAWLATLDDGLDLTKRGVLRVQSVLGPSKFADFYVKSEITDNGGWDGISVTPIQSNGTFLTGEKVCLIFFKNGDPGRAAIQHSFDASSVVMGDPGSGKFRTNNATLASVTQLAFSHSSLAGIDVTAFLETHIDASKSVIKGQLTLSAPDAGNAARQVIFNIRKVTTNAGWTQFDGTVSVAGSALTDTRAYNVGFARTGDASLSGPRFGYDNSSNAMADPGNGLFRLNNATIGSVTAIALDDLSMDGTALDAFITKFADSTSKVKGYLYIGRQDAPANCAVFAINSVVDNAGWTQINVTYVNGVALTAPSSGVTNYPYVFQFSRNGDAGNSGPRTAWDPSSQAMADPGAGKFRYDNATLASVLNIAMSYTDADGTDISAFIKSFGNSSSVTRGYLELVEQGAPSKRGIWRVTGLTDNTTWAQIAVTFIDAVAFDAANADSSLTLCNIIWARNGDRGSPAGIRWSFDTGTTMADPGSGKFRLNNATIASVTAMALSVLNSETGNPSVKAVIDTWDDSTTPGFKAYLEIVDVNNPEKFAIFAINTGNVDNTTWEQIGLTYLAGSGAFSNNSVFAIQVARVGNTAAGTGNVVGAASSTTHHLASFGDGTGTLLEDRFNIDTDKDGVAFSDTALMSQKAVLCNDNYFELEADLLGLNATGVQNLFGVGFVVAANVVYDFEIMAVMKKSAGTTSHTVSFVHGLNTATLTRTLYTGFLAGGAVATGEIAVAAGTMLASVAATKVITGAIAVAAESIAFVFKGSIVFGAAGGWIPQYSLSAAPGGAWTVCAGSNVRIRRRGASGANVNLGGWA